MDTRAGKVMDGFDASIMDQASGLSTVPCAFAGT